MLNIDLPSSKYRYNSMVKKACDAIKSYRLTKITIYNDKSKKFDSLDFSTDFSEVSAQILEICLAGNFYDLDNVYLFNNLEYLLWLAEKTKY